MNRRTVLAVSLGIVTLITGLTTAYGDDFLPPPWRGLPLTTTQGWEFLTPSNSPAFPDDPNVPQVWGDGGPGTPTATFGNMHWDAYDGDGGWIANDPTGGTIELYCLNWIDFEPIKWLRIQITTSGGPPPVITGIQAVDNDPLAVPTSGPFGPPVVLDPFHSYQDWYIIPNPNYEWIFIQVPVDLLIDEIIVDTISWPEPASVVLLGLGGLVMLRRSAAPVFTRRR